MAKKKHTENGPGTCRFCSVSKSVEATTNRCIHSLAITRGKNTRIDSSNSRVKSKPSRQELDTMGPISFSIAGEQGILQHWNLAKEESALVSMKKSTERPYTDGVEQC